MLRDKNLVPLSRQHQHALALCVRIDRAQPIRFADLPRWQAEIEQHFAQEIATHFSAEEEIIFPAALKFPQLAPLVEELIADHISLRESFSEAQARRMSAQTLPAFAQKLSDHIRKEERQLFEQMQKMMSVEDLAQLGKQLEHALEQTAQSCALTNQAAQNQAGRAK